MGQKLPPKEAELYKRCDEVLHYIWDPCGIAGEPNARDEYYSYLPQVFALVRGNEDAQKIAEHLAGIEEEAMGMTRNSARAEEAVEALIGWREKLRETPA